jgi:hypothetical protein
VYWEYVAVVPVKSTIPRLEGNAILVIRSLR